ncbi:S16 family serine protease [Actinomadura napierensis]|uniref:Lon proteolytic domain-containing protein n=1 Tax=Actinomadura napierensis TaxID=267854 RepID=A0ABN3AJJ3_9ACTN
MSRTDEPRHTRPPSASQFPDRAALVDLIERAKSPQAALREALGERQLLWKCCSEAVRTDPSWLLDGRCEQLRSWFEETAPDRVADSVTAADHAWLLGRSLSTPEDPTGEHEAALARLAEAWRQSKLVSAEAATGPAQPSGKGIDGLPPRVAGTLMSITKQLQNSCDGTIENSDPTGPQSMLVIAALLMAGAKPRKRPVVSMPVVFGRSTAPNGQAAAEEGVTGVLELREFLAGPVGLYPDPRAMAGAYSPNDQFADSLGRAWLTAGPRRQGRCVLWRLVLSEGPVPITRFEGPSLGVAFALSLRELLRYPPTRRPAVTRLRNIFYGLRPRTAVTGELSADERLAKVSGMNAKLLAAHREGLRLIAPEANQPDLVKAPDPSEVKFAATLKQADRYARRFRTGRLAIALSLLTTATATGLTVAYQGAAATERLAIAHRLANVSQRLLQTNVGLAGLFAVQAYRYSNDPLTRAALFQSVTTSPHLVGSVQASGPISALAASLDGNLVLAGTGRGKVEQWSLAGDTVAPARLLGQLRGPVTAVAADADGGTVAAIDHGTVRIWTSAQPVPAPRIPTGQRLTAVGVSPSGRFIAVTAGHYDAPPTMWVLDRTTGNTSHLKLDLQTDPSAIAFPSDSDVVTIEDSFGGWERFSLPQSSRTAGSAVGYGVHNQAFALAPDGGSFSYAHGDSTLPIWRSKGIQRIDNPPLLAQTHASSPTAALALSPGGSWAAEAADTSIYVSRATAPGKTPSTPVTLAGAGAVSDGALTFLGRGGTRLVSATDDVWSLWDLARYSRISTAMAVDIPFSCNACNEPEVILSPNGRSAAVINGFGAALDVQSLNPSSVEPYSLEGPLPGGQRYATALWQGNNTGLIMVSPDDGSAQIISFAKQWPQTIGTWAPLKASDPVVLLRYLPDSHQVAEVDKSGTIRFRDAATGKVLRQVNGPRDRADKNSWDLHRDEVALDPNTDHAAVIDTPPDGLFNPSNIKIVVTDTATSHSRTLPGQDAMGVAYTKDRLLVQRRNGDLEIWSASGDRRLGTLDGTPDTSVGPVVSGPGLIAEKASDDTVRLIDLHSGLALGTLVLPVGYREASTGLAFSADGTTLVTATESIANPAAGDTGVLIVWRLSPGLWIHAACTSAGRNLTPDLWRQYVGTHVPSDLTCTM